MTFGIFTIAVSGLAQLAGLAGVRSGRHLGAWFALLAVSAMGVTAGGLLVQDDPGASSWAIALPAAAIVSVIHARVLFSQGGPLRT